MKTVLNDNINMYFTELISIGERFAELCSEKNYKVKLFLLPHDRFYISGLISLGILNQRIKSKFYNNSTYEDLLQSDVGTKFIIQNPDYTKTCIKINHCYPNDCGNYCPKDRLYYEIEGGSLTSKSLKQHSTVKNSITSNHTNSKYLKIITGSNSKTNYITDWNDDILNDMYKESEKNILKSGVGLCTIINTKNHKDLFTLFDEFNILTTKTDNNSVSGGKLLSPAG